METQIRTRTIARIAVAAIILSGAAGFSSSTFAADPLSSLAKPVVRGALSTQSIYFVMTDRFFNGDPTNDLAGLADFRLTSGYDPTETGWYHGGDLKGLTSHLDYIKNMGFTSIWITPPVKQQYVSGSSAAYHGYWGIDFTTIDPHLGTEADFKKLVDTAHSKGLTVIVDIVVNHTADVIKYRDNGKPYIPLGQEKIKKPSWLNTISNYHNQGASSFTGDSLLNGDFYGLDDLFTEKPAVVKGWTDLWSSWITKYGIDGYRIDTARHVDAGFWKAFLPKILATAKAAGKKSFPIFGEIADSNAEDVAPFVTEQKFPSALDFPFQATVSNFAKSFGHAGELADLFNADDLYTTANTSAYGLATFLGNHDMGRIGMMIEKAASWDGPQVVLDREKLANALLFLLRGGPIVYYGDEKGMTGSGGDQLSRQDMFATQVPEWQTEVRIGGSPIGNSGAFDVHNPLEDQISNLETVTKANPALRSGTQQVRIADTNFFAVSRYADGQEYLVAFNSDDKEVTKTVQVSTAKSSWSPIAGAATSVTAGDTSVSLTLAPHGYVALKAESPFVPSSVLSIAIANPKKDGNSQGWVPVSASVPGNDFVTVTFVSRIGSGSWVSLGSTDKRTIQTLQVAGGKFRIYLHPNLYKKGTTLSLVAIVKSASGATAQSKIISYKIS